MLFGLSGGFIFGFLPMALLISLGKKHPIFFGALGLCVCYFLGATVYAFISGRTFVEAVLLTCVPYAVKDILSLFCAYCVAKNVKKRLPEIKSTK